MPDLALAIAMFIGGIVLLVLGGDQLVRGAVVIARELRVSTLIIGLTVVAFGTSAPELFLNLAAAMSDNTALSFGNVVGSNIANIALVLGIGALITPLVVHGRVVNRELPVLVVISALTCAMPWFLAGDGSVAYTRIGGVIFLGLFAVVLYLWYRVGKADRSDPVLVEAAEEAMAEAKGTLGGAIVATVIALVLLCVGGELTKRGAVDLASLLGLSEAIVGLTIVAVATSLPEVFTTIIACRKNQADLAVGNVVGSNMFNILLVLGATAVVTPVPVPPGSGVFDLGVMLGLTLLLWPMSKTNNRRVTAYEGVFLLVVYGGYLAVRTFIELR